MSTALLVDYFQQLPERVVRGPGASPPGAADPGEPARPAGLGKARWRVAVDAFKKETTNRYTEGTLLRLLVNPDPCARRAAVFALGLVGSPEVNSALAACLHDDDADVPYLAAEALWVLWFRGANSAQSGELIRLVRLRDRQQALAGLDKLLQEAPLFAEAYNQRAILNFRLRQYDRSVTDCEKTLELNQHHFGAQAGLGQCYLQLRKQRAALKALRGALRINPHLDGVAETVRALEKTLGEEGRRDDKR
jgi:tetratricopeptide (TPR) repeat protein